MFEFGNFDEAFTHNVGDAAHRPPIRRRKTLGQRLLFWSANLLLMPLVALVYLTVGAEGLRQLMSISQMRLYKLPVPGAGLMREYDGFNRLDLSMLKALILFGAVTFIWIRVFKELQGFGTIAQQRSRNRILFYMLSAVAAIILIADAGIFYVGLESQTSGWTEVPGYVPVAASILYMAGLALIGAWHADHSCNDHI